MNPRVTWWSQSAAFFGYINRSQFLLQQGHAVDDVLYFYGDEVPNFVRLKQDDPAHVLPGYDYDVTNEDALLRTLSLTPEGLRSPAGNVYRLLALPKGRRLSLASLERIAAYVRQGGSVVGEVPLAPTGNVPAKEAARFDGLVGDVWRGCPATHKYEAGNVFCGTDTRAALAALNLPPDFEAPEDQVDYVHRRDGAVDIYFVRNRTAKAVDVRARFRVHDRAPQLWDAVEGTVVPQLVYAVEGERTAVPLRLAPYGSAFVVFSEPVAAHVTEVVRAGGVVSTAVTGSVEDALSLPDAAPGNYVLKVSDGRELSAEVSAGVRIDLPAAQWTVAFQPGRGGPSAARPLAGFTDWSASNDAGVPYFSGTATYRTTVQKPSGGGRTFLSLTDLHEICTVRINGTVAGTIWARPYRLDITDSLSAGSNRVELEVTNLWPNRIIGDAQPGVARTYTKTNIRKYRADSPLLPSGLIGPVTLETEPAVAIRR